MRSWFIPWTGLGVPNGSLTVMINQLWWPNIPQCGAINARVEGDSLKWWRVWSWQPGGESSPLRLLNHWLLDDEWESALEIWFCRCVEAQGILSKYLKASTYLEVLIPQGNVVIDGRIWSAVRHVCLQWCRGSRDSFMASWLAAVTYSCIPRHHRDSQIIWFPARWPSWQPKLCEYFILVLSCN